VPIDPDEAPQDAVVREVWEETGLRVEPTRLCGVFGGPEFRVTYENGDESHYVMAVFECRRIGGDAATDGDERSTSGSSRRRSSDDPLASLGKGRVPT
jgi:8-oxo-dGTP pyrophosphatase MutT (NUDIX family)